MSDHCPACRIHRELHEHRDAAYADWGKAKVGPQLRCRPSLACLPRRVHHPHPHPARRRHRMSEQLDHKVAAYMAAIAAALESVPTCKTSYGEFYVSEATISFDGDETGYAVVADEHGGYAVQIGRTNIETAPPADLAAATETKGA